jgi:starch phosphorylase
LNVLGQLSVYPTADPRITRITELAYNLWWSWHPEAQALYQDIDPDLWKLVNQNPVLFLRRVGQQKLDRVANDTAYVDRYNAVMNAFDIYMQPDQTWYSRTYPDLRDRQIAYFSAEFGLHESLPIYSGGLGVLAGDHCKAASDLGLPFVGVGFLYPQGYFQQRIDSEGHQQAVYAKLNFADVPATPALDASGNEIIVSVNLPGRAIYAKVWRIQVGRVPVYLMDTDVARNAPADRELSARLYGGNQELRVAQEIVLGIGGVRVLRALGLQPSVWHMNEGHAAFLQLERIREHVQEGGLSFADALWAARADALFTTHTPVPAGNDAFPPNLMERFFSDFWPRMGIGWEQFWNLGCFEYPWGPQFSMTVLALRTAGRANGVSRLHGVVAREMWQSLYPNVPLPEIPIGHVTNGVHSDSWLDPEMAALYDRYLGPAWRERLDAPATWQGVYQIPDQELWSVHADAKRRMIDLVRERSANQLARIGADPAEINAASVMFDPNVLTIGFGRRYATYKRATLIFRDQERLKRILNDPKRPVQIVFAGKAHPADEPGKSLIQFVYQMSQQPGFAGCIVFVEDYDTNIARHMVAGADVWLNNPRRPLEASGTSGEKASLNGVPNLSVLDGWWVEGYNGQNGWAIGEEREYSDEAAQDEADALSLYRLLEDEVVPLFYERDEQDIPRGWLAIMRAAIASVAPQFSLNRMLKDYVNQYYIPAGALGQKLAGENYAGARALSDWERRVKSAWPQVHLRASGPASGEIHVGQSIKVEATLQLGPLNPDDLSVELVYGQQQDGNLKTALVAPMLEDGNADGQLHYSVNLSSPDSGRFVYGVRVRPNQPDLPNPFALPMIRWA